MLSCVFLAVVLAAGVAGTAMAANIIWVCGTEAAPYPDVGFTDMLTAAGGPFAPAIPGSNSPKKLYWPKVKYSFSSSVHLSWA